MSQKIPNYLDLLEKFASLFRAPKHVQKAYLENPSLHKRLSSAGGRATAAKRQAPKAPPKAKPMKQMTFDKKLDTVPYEEGLKMIQDLKKRVGVKNKTAAAEDSEQNIKSKLNFFQRALLNGKINLGKEEYQRRQARHAFDVNIRDKYMTDPAIEKLVKKIQNKNSQKLDNYSNILGAGSVGGLVGMLAGTPSALRKDKLTPMFIGGGIGALIGGYGGHKLHKSYADKVNTLTPEELQKYITTIRDKEKAQHDKPLATFNRDFQKADDLLAPAGFAAAVGNIGAGVGTAVGAKGLSPVKEKTLKELIANSGVGKRVAVHPPAKGEHVPLLMNNAYFKSTSNKYTPSGPLGEVNFIGSDFYKPGILAHELGHANIHGSKGLPGFLQRKLYGPTMLANTYGLGGIANALGSYYATKNEDDVGMGALKGGLAGSALNAGILVPEFEASRRGIQNLLKSSLPAKSKVTNSLSLLPAFLTYLLSTGGVGAGVGAFHAYGNKKAKKKKVKTGELVKLSKSQILKDLIEAKKLSDDRDYVQKNALIRKVVLKYPDQFKVDSYLNRAYVGLTHKPTGFKIHAQKSGLPSELFKD